MKTLFSFLILIASHAAFCQSNIYQVPDYERISKDIADSTSAFFYPKLMARLGAADSSLDIVDFRYLYFGYARQKQYEPYWTFSEEDKLQKYMSADKIKERDYEKIINLCHAALREFPFDLRTIGFADYIYYKSGDTLQAAAMRRRYQGILDAILSTGNGRTCESAYHVISVSHEYELLHVFGVHSNMQSLNGDCDYLRLDENKANVAGLYFNIEVLFNKLHEQFKDK